MGGKRVDELASISHTHNKTEITDFAHTHNINEITNLLIYYAGTTTNSGNNYSVTVDGITSYIDGLCIVVKINANSTGATTLNVNGLGAKSIKKANGSDVTNLKADGIYTLRYNATTGNFILQGEGGEYGTAGAPQVLAGYTIGTENGLVNGTMPNRSAEAYHQNALEVQVGTFTGGNPNIRVYMKPPNGYYDGLSWVATDAPNLKPENIKEGVNIFGVVGTLKPAKNIYEYSFSTDILLSVLSDGNSLWYRDLSKLNRVHRYDKNRTLLESIITPFANEEVVSAYEDYIIVRDTSNRRYRVYNKALAVILEIQYPSYPAPVLGRASANGVNFISIVNISSTEVKVYNMDGTYLGYYLGEDTSSSTIVPYPTGFLVYYYSNGASTRFYRNNYGGKLDFGSALYYLATL